MMITATQSTVLTNNRYMDTKTDVKVTRGTMNDTKYTSR